MKTSLISILLFFVVISSGAALEDERWITDFKEVKTIASESGRPILANFAGSDWCYWCKKLDREVLSKPEFNSFAKEKLVLFLADFPRRKSQPETLKSQNEGLLRTYRVPGFPTVLLLDAEGNVLARTGYQSGGPKAYVKHLETLIEQTQGKN